MCPGRGRVPGRNVSGPTHRSAPTESIAIPSKPRGTGGDGAPPLPGYQGCQAAGRCGHRPLRGEGKAQSTALASSAQRSVCGADARDGRRGRQRSPPKVFSNLGQSLSRGKTATAPFAQGSLGLRGTRRTSPGHRSSQQPQAGRDRARPLREHRECRSVGRCT